MLTPYLSLFLLLLAFAINKKRYVLIFNKQNRNVLSENILYTVLFFFMLIVISFSRYRSHDFEYYIYYYNSAPTTFNLPNQIFFSYHIEPIWVFIFTFFRMLGFSYAIFFIIATMIMVLMVNGFINRYCYENKTLALVYAYTSFYLVYPYIGFRQGMAISIFMMFMIPLIEKRRWKAYICMTLFCSLFHTAGFIYMIVPLLINKSINALYKMLIFSIIFGILSSFIQIDKAIFGLIPMSSVQHYLEEGNKTFYIVYRYFFLVLILYSSVYIKRDANSYFIYKLYLIGFIVYFCTCNSYILSSRLFDSFKFIEIVVYMNFLKYSTNKNNKIVFRIILSLLFVWMLFHHVGAINMSIKEITHSYTDYPIWQTPYISFTLKELGFIE